MRGQAVCFDLDGTLLDSFHSHARVYEAVFRDLQLPFDDANYVKHYSPNWYAFYERMGVPRERWEQADGLWLHYYAREQPQSRDGATDLLHWLRSSDRLLGLVTSGDRSRVERDLAAMGWTDLFNVVVCGGDVPERKPHPAALQHALRQLNAEASAAVYVGDTADDVVMGRAVGVMTVAVAGGFGSRESLQSASPDLLLDNLSDLVRFL